MDGIMGKVGLSGKAFLPMLLGFGCTVPAIMAAPYWMRQQGIGPVCAVFPLFAVEHHLIDYIFYVRGNPGSACVCRQAHRAGHLAPCSAGQGINTRGIHQRQMESFIFRFPFHLCH